MVWVVLSAVFVAGVLLGEAETVKFKPLKSWFLSDWYLEKLRPAMAKNWLLNNVLSFVLGGFHLWKTVSLLVIFFFVPAWPGVINPFGDMVLLYAVFGLGFVLSYHDFFKD